MKSVERRHGYQIEFRHPGTGSTGRDLYRETAGPTLRKGPDAAWQRLMGPTDHYAILDMVRVHADGAMTGRRHMTFAVTFNLVHNVCAPERQGHQHPGRDDVKDGDSPRVMYDHYGDPGEGR